MVAAFVLLVFIHSACAAQSRSAVGDWQGNLTFRGADMPVRVQIQSVEEPARATIDIPGMLLAWEPVAARPAEDGFELEFPFGLGWLALKVQDRKARATKELAGDTLSLSLERAPPPAFKTRDVEFRSGETTLAAKIVLPPGRGPHPGVVLLHGSGRQGKDSWQYRSWADLLVRQGLAVLYYDKRGVGESGGDYDAGLRQLADDGLAAVQFFRAQPEVDSRRVGLKGASQGAWLALDIAGEPGDVAFLILVSAASGTPRDQELQKIEYGMRSGGRSAEEIEDALAYTGLYFYVARTGNGWDLLAQEIERAKNAGWGQHVDQPRSLSDLAWWRDNHDFRPATAFNDFNRPVLLLYGGADWITPAIENAEKLRSSFGNPQKVDIHVFDDADHRMEVPAGRNSDGIWRWPGVAPGLRSVIGSWLQEKVLQQHHQKKEN